MKKIAIADSPMSINIGEIIAGAKVGDSEAELLLGLLFYLGNHIDPNPEVAVEWITKAANQGSSLAKYLLSDMLKEGKGTQLDLEKSFEYLKTSADAGFFPAKLRLAEYYGDGIGVKKDIETKKTILAAMAAQGSAQAALRLGIYFNDQNNGEFNPKEARKWFSLADSLGSRQASFFLASSYKHAGDYIQAVNYFNRACDLGDDNACVLMALYYSKGIVGLEKNAELAKQYSDRAHQIQSSRKTFIDLLF